MQKFGELNFVKTGLKCKFGVNPQSFSHELCLYITRFAMTFRPAGLSRDPYGLGEKTASHLVWHSKADKIVNFYGQNRFQFHGQRPIFMVKTLIFVVKTDFLMVRPTNFLVRSRNILVAKFLGQSPFHSNAKISCSTLFYSNFMFNSVPFQQHFMVSHAIFGFGRSLYGNP